MRTWCPMAAGFLEEEIIELADRPVRSAEVITHLAAIPSAPFSIEKPLESHRALVETTLAVLAAAERAEVSLARLEVNFSATTFLEEGLRATLDGSRKKKRIEADAPR